MMRSVALPVFNEEGNIERTIGRVLLATSSWEEPFEILVVDNASSDNTAIVVNELSSRHPNVRLISQTTNTGYMGNVKRAMSEAKGTRVFILDGDGQFDPAVLLEMDREMEEGSDLVLGYRTVRAGPVYRRALSLLFLRVARYLIHFDLKDVNSGARALSSQFIRTNPIRLGSNMVNPELFLRARIGGFKISEVPVGHEVRSSGRTTHEFSHPIRLANRTIGYLFQLRRDRTLFPK